MTRTAHNRIASGRGDALRRRRLISFALLLGVVLAGISVAVLRAKRPSQSDPNTRIDLDELLSQATAAFQRRDLEATRRQAEEVLSRDPRNPAALLLVAKCLETQSDFKAAVAKYAEVPAGHPPHSTEAACRRGHLLMLKLGRLSEAERAYRRAIGEDPYSLAANTGLSMVYGFSRQWWQEISTELAIIRHGKHELANLFALSRAEDGQDRTLDANRLRRDAPTDPLVRLSAASLAIENQKYAEAIAQLQAALRDSPDLVQAHVLLGETYLVLGRTAEFVSWSRNLPEAADRHPTTWVVRGKWARRHSTPHTALRCYCEAVQLDPNQPEALFQVGQILTGMNRPDDAAPFLLRARALQQFVQAVTAANSDDLQAQKRAAILAESLGNTWEAYGWATAAASHPTGPEWAKQTVARLKPRLAALPLERTESRFNPARRFPFRSLPLPSIAVPRPASVAKRSTPGAAARFSFEDRAASAGISFRYFNSSRDVRKGMEHVYETMGGGVGVIDFDGDLRPDLYFTQGCAWPVDESRMHHLDRLYLNRGDGRFMDVTDSCGIRENRFSQGVSVGDFDSDGFPDLLVANIGRNRLYHNNGDGTFSDVSDEAGLTRSDWTTSCAIADLNGDGHPELYFVNYLQGPNVFTLLCGAQRNHVCGPQQFDGANDRLFWNTGDGRFRDVTETSGILQKDGKGLGIAIARFGGAGLPNVFIANDMTPNFYFENQTKDPRSPPVFRETAMIKGLALSDQGRAQACMGVAAGDGDGDGGIELFVTNFLNESNAYYRLEHGSFRDVAQTRGLREPSLKKLGFGTQFLDADLDGWPDLIVTNGHIDNFSHNGRSEYQMQPQFFENVGRGYFREVDAATLGPFFQRKLLGRGLARIDWNGDGREEAVISHLDAPAALLENTTKSAGGFLALYLRGVQSSRDAIGTVAQVRTKDRMLTRQLTAGDGFHACNERVLVFGLGNALIVETLTVRWPSGRRQVFPNLPRNSRWIIVEGAARPYPAPEP